MDSAPQITGTLGIGATAQNASGEFCASTCRRENLQGIGAAAQNHDDERKVECRETNRAVQFLLSCLFVLFVANLSGLPGSLHAKTQKPPTFARGRRRSAL